MKINLKYQSIAEQLIVVNGILMSTPIRRNRPNGSK